MAANEDLLGKLHEAVTGVLLQAMDGEVLPGYTNPETGEEIPEKKMLPSAAIIAAATKFLKDNEITCVPSGNSKLADLKQQLKERRELRMSREDRMAAQESAGFLSGLAN